MTGLAPGIHEKQPPVGQRSLVDGRAKGGMTA
jgi:hypothetical protein